MPFRALWSAVLPIYKGRARSNKARRGRKSAVPIPRTGETDMATTSIRRIGPASAAEINVFCTQALMGTFAKVGPQFERDTGNKLTMTYGATAQLVARMAK